MQHETYWSEWAGFLKKRGMDGFAAWLLEAGAPLAPVGAQLLYMGQPLFGKSIRDDMSALAVMLESDQQTQNFVTFLKEGPP
jgi:hypothetical protein